MKKKIILIIIVIAILVGAGYYFSQKLGKEEPKPSETVLTEEEIEDLNREAENLLKTARDNEYVFTVGSAPRFYPKFLSGRIFPQYSEPGDEQELSIKLEDPNGILWVKAEIEESNGVNSVELVLSEGDETLGIWQGVYKILDAHPEHYQIKFIAHNKLGQEDDLDIIW